MSAAADFQKQPAAPEVAASRYVETIARLGSAGYKLLPLGDGPDGKKPLIANWSAARGCSVKTSIELMQKRGSQMYGIRLEGLVVVDCDTDNTATRNYVEQHFGLSPFMTRTTRGLHYWFKAGFYVPPKVRLPDISIDFKTGAGSFVVGPDSVRPDNGKVYQTAGSPLGFAARLPIFQATPPLWERDSKRAEEGTRDRHLYRRGIELALVADSEAEVFEELCAYRDLECENPEGVSNAEVRAKAKWAWRHREKLYLWGGRNSTFAINRSATAALAGHKKGDDAALLYMVLSQTHGHRHEIFFTVVAEGLIAKGHLPNQSKSRIYRDILTLIEVNLLALVRRGHFDSVSKRRQPHIYKLCLPHHNGEGEV
ncbi:MULTISPECIES: bifunctional DNA primase/polymerase [unclassified Mesorhizobium]|uniref:bifunctional DNA primase/polymerase n=1 Tax=unclassified Mesorhizobium TaxID=325217 RepID=UPI0003D02B9F|nr:MULTISPECIES: bifunctional DNA primase/polymerase [unclassified Mesorhizobium]ESZ07162.1 hypothetical protein X736_10935 [Mesorhizobium sp. L2C089B000]WJI52554.1 bifunctional DNA primase/polymerase [Mesorhizobium sp. C089B]